MKKFFLLAACLTGLAQAADPVSQSIQTQQQISNESTQSQHKIDQLDTATQQNLQQYRLLLQQISSEQQYHDYLESLLKAQQIEISTLETQQNQIAQTQVDIVPLLQQQINQLAELVAQDLPFLPEERQLRLLNLYQLMPRADISLADKFKQLLNAYQIEVQYGYNVEQTTGTIQSGDTKQSVNFLRIGRLAYYYQTLDGLHSAIWDLKQKGWQALDAHYNAPLQQAIAVANQSQIPDLLQVPVFKRLAQGVSSDAP